MDWVETKLGGNFKHRTILFVNTNTSLTRKNDKQIENEYNNNKWRTLDKL